MPRQIIDVESSRPAYERRRLRRIIIFVAIVLIVAAAVWFLAQRVRAEETLVAAGTLERECCLSVL
ncbi:MAG TPA: hypothetical protein VHS56_04170 [Candidatus Cybelea sp.]|jgi:hypothetical protein|nr:hypothetical protein [Candidatus Cybelea sp.]